ncbi:hypothetical protein ACVIHC_002217 [Bradyrhizobium diazoefficiens]
MELPDIKYLKQVADHWSKAQAGQFMLPDCAVLTDGKAREIAGELKALIEYAEKASERLAS